MKCISNGDPARFKEQITELHDTVAEHHEEHVKAQEEEAAPSVVPACPQTTLLSEVERSS